ncbi:hypothetical protein, partial [Frankia sp. CiP3]|uniref:hypothetical protein n=1 Tax=Frankia sp. CiP3 TaxID=2880971 RepID=UPI001EF4B673
MSVWLFWNRPPPAGRERPYRTGACASASAPDTGVAGDTGVAASGEGETDADSTRSVTVRVAAADA